MCNLLTNRKWASDEVEAVATWLCVCENMKRKMREKEDGGGRQTNTRLSVVHLKKIRGERVQYFSCLGTSHGKTSRPK